MNEELLFHGVILSIHLKVRKHHGQSSSLALASALTLANAATITGRVVGVADGDTVTVLDASNTQHKIRLSGIDTPERKQAFGMRSKQSLSGLVFNKQVSVETDRKDRYQREVGKILLPSGQDVNLEQVSRGFAWHYKANDRKLYDFAEQEARAGRRGLWGDAVPVPPWEFRRGSR
ncbi:MAG: thermonuclease family protein [Rhodoferax sp.]|uniref:thermonuclease family protein n=1 Tax=Rhodoferax sp. TaxID=50421 RepID=UPI0026163FF2|nr:thermonuclease family protein [Rhodoferax sp.]MDD2882950.1 thermonuclease family protein [Rhodoferax sp.]